MSKKVRIEYEAGEQLSLEQAQTLAQGQTLYNRFQNNADGTPERWRVTSVKTWKTRPNEVLVKVQRGIYQFDSFNEHGLHWLSTEQREVPCK